MFLVWQFVVICLNLVCFLLLQIIQSIFLTKGDITLHRHITHMYIRTHTHKQFVSNAPVLHVFDLWGKTGAPGRRKPTSSNTGQGEHASKQTPHKKASSWFKSFCNCSDLFQLLWWLILEKTVSPKGSAKYLQNPEAKNRVMSNTYTTCQKFGVI